MDNFSFFVLLKPKQGSEKGSQKLDPMVFDALYFGRYFGALRVWQTKRRPTFDRRIFLPGGFIQPIR